MDPVSITLGVLPLVGGAIKSYKAVHKKLKIFRHYSREVRQVQKQLERQSHFFVNEIHLLLRQALEDERSIQLMIKHAHHPRWRSNALEAGMQAMLGEGYRVCQDVIEELGSTIESLQDALSCFDGLAAECRQVHMLRLTCRT